MKKAKFPKRCPHCGAEDYESDYEADAEDLIEIRVCVDCNQGWRIVYEFQDWETC